jgi:hypothetical protein
MAMLLNGEKITRIDANEYAQINVDTVCLIKDLVTLQANGLLKLTRALGWHLTPKGTEAINTAMQ